jgi:superfamily II DNA or RNA helicase
MPITDLESLRAPLVQTYGQLTAIEQSIVQLFSVIYEPVGRAAILTCVNQAKLHQGKAFTAVTFKPYLDKLINQGMLVQPSGIGPQCTPLLIEIATREAIVADRFEAFVEVIEQVLPVPLAWKGGPRRFTNQGQFLREARIGLYRGDLEFLSTQFNDFNSYGYGQKTLTIDAVVRLVINNPFDPAWVRNLPDELSEMGILSLLDDSVLNLTPVDGAWQMLREDCEAGSIDGIDQMLLAQQSLLRGHLDTAKTQLEAITEFPQDVFADQLANLTFLQGDNATALTQYALGLKSLRKRLGKRKVYFSGSGGLFLIFALLKEGSGPSLTEALGYATLGRQAKETLSSAYEVLEDFIKFQQGDLAAKARLMSEVPLKAHKSWDFLVRAYCVYWTDRDAAKTLLHGPLTDFYARAAAAGYRWFALEAADLLLRLQPSGPGTGFRTPLEKGAKRGRTSKAIATAKSAAKSAAIARNYGPVVADLRKEIGTIALADLVQSQEAWEICLNALTNLHAKPDQTTAATSGQKQRLAWFLSMYRENWSLQPREQSVNAKGEWSKGRNVAIKRLAPPSELTYLTPQDTQVGGYIKVYSQGWGSPEYGFDPKAITALIDHPLVFWEDAAGTRVEIVKGEPELLVKEGKGDQLTLQLVPALRDGMDLLVVKETPTRVKVIQVQPEHRRIAAILGSGNQLAVPAAAKERVLAAISAIAGILTVQSDIGGGGHHAETVPSHPGPHLHLLPAGTGLKVAILVRPFPEGGPYYRPGLGGATVMAEVAGQRLQTTRDLKTEKQQAKAAIGACSVLTRELQDDDEWLIEEPEDCLELLLELQALPPESVTIEWPQGEKLRVKQQVGLGDFKMRIQRQNDWFGASGEIQLADETVMDMQTLMGLMDKTSGRFIPIGEGQFLALTAEFRKRLDELRAFSNQTAKGTQMHPLAAIALEDWIDEVGELKADKAWKDHIKRLKSAQALEPELPSTLQAELRDYQLDGFRWLARLAHWGVGACLADDMGLGKTLQSLALILTRAPEGPTLVIAPTSVGMNWISEAERFAPTLKVQQFGSGDANSGRTAQRQKLLDGIGPFDLLVCSYGLLQQEDVGEMLAKVQWQTIVLDEAQSIKNFATKRSQAAMNLQGGFKLLTTGTPIENHLGELWNLFRFINPGLLGSLENFNLKFATPIERYADHQARQRLKTLIQPFLLRRTKTQVLQELPSRTEILLNVELSKEELAFYEALRRAAIEKLTATDAPPGAKHLQVLAEIMKLRRACCNTQLVKSEIALPSAKLQLFGEVLTELLENRHKALVFSQFVDHLHLIRDYLDQRNISYQYLDGSTPAKDRKKRVDAFQAGQGDVFLISLKAGGTGLNLTAADYVIHMDPWWNPAVEDQASDRAHRIGQKRPVTIYRLVAKATIEEKIVAMHAQKRDLADSLLEGTEMSGKVSTDELLQLIREG